MTVHPLWNQYRNIRQMCYNPNNASYPHIGAQGITCAWDKFWDFSEDIEKHLGDRPDDTHCLIRKDQTKNYDINNLEWGTPKERGNRMFYCKYYKYKGKSLTLSQWADEYGINSGRVYDRIKRGWTLQEALGIKARKPRYG